MAKWPPMTQPKGALLHNDDSHGFADPNGGGGPLPRGNSGMTPHKRGGFGANARKQPPGPKVGPGNAGGKPRVGGPVRGTPSQTRVPGHGGGPQKDGNVPSGSRGGFTHSGQKGVASGKHANPPMKSGNTSGRSYKLIAGRFKRAAMGAKPTGESGKYGSAPITTNT